MRGLLLCHLLACLGLHALGSEIINGREAVAKQFPYMASVQVKGKHVCGGFLVDKSFVLTAAHCADKLQPTRVVLGTHNLQGVQKVNTYDIKLMCKNPSYEKPAKGDDIMLLKLSRKVRLDKKLQTISLPKAGMNIKDKTNCTVAGWGLTKTRGEVVDRLNAVDVPVVNWEDCRRKWASRNSELPANVICAGGYGTNKGFCQGDSGGPLVCNGKAVGVVSYNMGSNCDYPNLPNVYTNISKYLPWIEATLKKQTCANSS